MLNSFVAGTQLLSLWNLSSEHDKGMDAVALLIFLLVLRVLTYVALRLKYRSVRS